MKQDFINADQYRVKELFILGKQGPIDIQNMYEEINLYDSIFMPVMSGNIIITDSLGLTDILSFDGTEVISVHLTKTRNNLSFRKTFRIYKQSDRMTVNQNTERYLLHFVSDDYIRSITQKTNTYFFGSFSQVALKIMKKHLYPKMAIPNLKTSPALNKVGNFVVEVSTEEREVIVPNLHPLEAISWCAKRARSSRYNKQKNISVNVPEYLFYSDNENYNFVTLSSLMTRPSVLPKITFGVKNTKGNDPEEELYLAKGFEVVEQVDVANKISNGAFANKFVGYDTMTGAVYERSSFDDDIYNLTSHANKSPIKTQMDVGEDPGHVFLGNSTKSQISVFPGSDIRGKNEYIKKNGGPKEYQQNENYETLLTQRKAIFSRLLSKKIKLSLPGNFLLTSGKMIDLDVAPFAEKFPNQKNVRDQSLSGKYLIVATRHIIGFNSHTTFLEIATDSTNDRRELSGTKAQNDLARKKYN